MTSRSQRDTKLRLVNQQPIAAVRRAAAARRTGPPRPPDGTPDSAELAAQARAVLAHAARLARWADPGGGRTRASGRGAPLHPEPSGILPLAELQQAAAALKLTQDQVRQAWDQARLAGLVELRDGAARPGWRLRAWSRDDTAVLRGWVALFDAWSLCHPAPADSDIALVAEVIEAAPQLLSLLHLSSGPVPLPALLDLLSQRVAELRTERREPPTESREGAAAPLPALLEWTLDALVSVGALRPRSTADEEVVLTPLGSWAVWVKLEQICVSAQGPAGHIEQSAEDLLRACAQYSPGPARVEYRAWLAARPSGQAVGELLEVARGDDALLRGLAFEALRTVGAPAEPAVRAVVREPQLRPYALLWLAEERGSATRRSRPRSSPARRPPGCGWTPPPRSPTTGRAICWSAIWRPPFRTRCPGCWTRSGPPAIRAPCRCSSRWPRPTRTPRSPRRYDGPRSRCTPAGSRRQAPGETRLRTPGRLTGMAVLLAH